MSFNPEDYHSDSSGIGRVPLQFILECSVDDGSKMLEIPLLAIPGYLNCPESKQQQQLIDMSNEILHVIEECAEEAEEGGSSLQKIQRAMEQSGKILWRVAIEYNYNECYKRTRTRKKKLV